MGRETHSDAAGAGEVPSTGEAPSFWRRGAIDAGGGLLVAAIGAIFFFGALGYSLGTPSRMGPGFVPLVLGVICFAIGIATAIQDYRRGHGVVAPNWRPFLFISSSVLVFAATIHSLGLLPSVALTVAVAAQADASSRAGPTLLLALIIAGACWTVFQLGLNMTMPAFMLPF